MSDTTFADVNDVYQHIVCSPLGIGLCGQYQEEIVWFSIPCSVCQLVLEMTTPGQCALKEGPCDCFDT